MTDIDLKDQIAAAEAYESLHVPALFEQWAPRLLDAVPVKPGSRVLDVACGTGVLAREAVSRVGTAGFVAGIDPGPGMLAVAERLASIRRETFAITKREIRRPTMVRVRSLEQTVAQEVHAQWLEPGTLDGIREYLERTIPKNR